MRCVAVLNSGRPWRALADNDGEYAAMKIDFCSSMDSERDILYSILGEGERALLLDILMLDVGCGSGQKVERLAGTGGLVGVETG